MITIACTSCKETLEIDDAFAGGVCRCQHCGAIQTVPSHLKNGTGAPAAKAQKTLYQNRARGDSLTGTGLDELADVVASSGISSGLSSRREMPPSATATAAKKKQNMLMYAGGGAIAVLLVIVAALLLRSGDDGVAGPAGSGRTIIDSSGEVVPIPTGPSFAGIPLQGNVVYVLDRGGSTSDAFGDLIQATLKSLQSLQPSQKYQVLFWSDGSTVTASPAIPALAVPANLDATRQDLESAFAFGQTDARPALEKAVTERPDTIVVATAKGWDLDESFAAMVKEVLGDRTARVHTISIGSVGEAKGLRLAAEQTGGQFREVSRGELAQFGR